MSRYASTFASPQGPGDARPTALQIVKDEGAEGALKGEVVVITGTSSGIGIETVRALAATGATLFLTARNTAKADKALEGIFDASRMTIVEMDQESFASVRAAAKTILDKTAKIHMLINNAGIMSIPTLQFTKDGHELQFGTNHLSHFLFYKLLEPALLANASAALPSRVVNLSSSAHNVCGINASDNYNYQDGSYNPSTAYGQSKTANIYMANEIERRHGSSNLHALSLHPGIIQTALLVHMPPDAFKGQEHLFPLIKSPEQGAATTVYAAVAHEWKGKGGKYLVDCQVAPPHKEGDDKFVSLGYAPWAFDEGEAKRLWKDSLEIVGLPADKE